MQIQGLEMYVYILQIRKFMKDCYDSQAMFTSCQMTDLPTKYILPKRTVKEEAKVVTNLAR